MDLSPFLDTLAEESALCWRRTCLSGPVQVISRRRRRILLPGCSVRRAKRLASQSRAERGRVAVVKPLETRARRGRSTSLAQRVARSTTASLAGAGQRTPDG